MKLILGAILGVAMASSPLLARQEPADKQKQQEPKTQEPPPSPKADSDKKQEPPEKKQEPPSAKQDKSGDKRQQRDAKQQEKEMEKQSKGGEKKNRDNNQAQPQQQQQNSRQYAQESHSKGKRIPPQKFQANFGRAHHFQVKHLEEGRRFEYSGYSFEVVEPWPADWSYDDKYCIEQHEDIYYLVDILHPSIHVLVIVV
jgi:outer membrane biosynthesis protein TonB